MKMKNTILIIFAFALAVTSCKKEESVMEKDDKIIQNYFANKNITDAIKDPSGIYIQHIAEGVGESPALSDYVSLKYELYSLPEDTKIPQTQDSVTTLLDNLFPAWKVGIPYIKKGGLAYLYVPSSYFNQNGKVLKFKISLIDVKTQAEQAVADDKVIQDYFTANNITNTIADPSGVYIQHITEGTGNSPALNDRVTVKYELYNLPSDTRVPQTNDPITFELDGLIEGWKIGIPYMKKGGVAYLYIPSTHAYHDGRVLKYKITLINF